MRIAVISDIHGNLVSLDAVLAEIRANSADQIICLGDCVQGGPQPAQVVARLRELACPIVMGNADSFLLTGEDTALEPTDPARWEKLLAVREWTLSQLSSEDRAFIARFQPTVEIGLDETRKLIGFHGSPRSFDEIIVPETPDAEAQKMLGGFAPHFLCGGHTHIQQIRHLGAAFYFGCGSTSLPFRYNYVSATKKVNPWAEFALFTADTNRVSLDFRRIPFALEDLFEIYRASGRPYTDEAIEMYR
jgi:predicted phosphodiesterase